MKTFFPLALDASFLGAISGIGSYTAGFIRALSHLAQHDPVFLIRNELPSTIPLFARQEDLIRSRFSTVPPNWQWIQSYHKQRMKWLFFTLPKLLKHYHPRIFHAMDCVSVPPRSRDCRKVITLHDIIPLTHPQYCPVKDALAGKYLLPRAIKKADMIITGSQYTADQVACRYPFAETKIHIIHYGVDHGFFQPTENREALAQHLENDYGLFSSCFVLCVATLNPRRNLLRFLEAFQLFLQREKGSDACLVIVGCRGWKDQPIFQKVKDSGIEDRVHFLDYVEDEMLLKFYQSAIACAIPSLIEGFGLPVIEAMACGTPVLCSSTTSLGEIAGQSALLFDPSSSQDMAEAIHTICSDEIAQKEYGKKGLQHAQNFSWQKHAEITLSIYRTLL